MITFLLYLYNNILDVAEIVIFPYQSFGLAIVKYRALKLLTSNLNLLKSNTFMQRIFHFKGVNADWLAGWF